MSRLTYGNCPPICRTAGPNGKTYAVGGLYGQTEHAYLREEWIDSFQKNEADFQLVDFSVKPLTTNVDWQPATWTMNHQLPGGRELTLHFASPLPALAGIEVAVH